MHTLWTVLIAIATLALAAGAGAPLTAGILRWAERQVKADASPPSDGESDLRTVCLVVSNSFSAPAYVRTAPGMPLELTVDLVPSSDAPTGPDLGRGWLLLVVLTGTGLVSGLVMGWRAAHSPCGACPSS